MENIPYWRATATAAAAVVVVVVVVAVVVRSSSSSNVLHWLSIITIIITSFISPITCSFSMRYILTKWCSCFFLCLFGFCFSLGFSFLFWSFVFTSILCRVYFNCPFSDFCQWHTPLYLTPTLERFRILPTHATFPNYHNYAKTISTDTSALQISSFPVALLYNASVSLQR